MTAKCNNGKFYIIRVQKVAVQLCTPVVQATHDTWGHREVNQSCVLNVPWAAHGVHMHVFSSPRTVSRIDIYRHIYVYGFTAPPDRTDKR